MIAAGPIYPLGSTKPLRLRRRAIHGWDLTELQLHRQRQRSAVQEVLERIERIHDDPQVAQEYRLLCERADSGGRAADGARWTKKRRRRRPEPASGQITPGSDRPAGKKSSLWTPS
jgi:hypothetical protein